MDKEPKCDFFLILLICSLNGKLYSFLEYEITIHRYLFLILIDKLYLYWLIVVLLVDCLLQVLVTNVRWHLKHFIVSIWISVKAFHKDSALRSLHLKLPRTATKELLSTVAVFFSESKN
jgi:hypothetical protein